MAADFGAFGTDEDVLSETKADLEGFASLMSSVCDLKAIKSLCDSLGAWDSPQTSQDLVGSTLRLAV